MRLLAIDTSGPAASAAVAENGRVVSAVFIEDNKTHSEKLAGLVDFALSQAGITPAELQGIAVASGPGSFTGLRIGMSFAKAMAQALGLPLLGVNTLDALCFAAAGPMLRAAVMDARRQEVYCAAYRGDALIIEHGARKLTDFLDLVRTEDCPAVFAGDGVRVYREAIAHTLKERAHFLPEPLAVQSAAAVAMLAFGAQRSAWGDAFTLVPSYYRQSQAEREAARRG
jgi:tRNA threonylcarbamoyladenosine biosynthesis protein TsaB